MHKQHSNRLSLTLERDPKKTSCRLKSGLPKASQTQRLRNVITLEKSLAGACKVSVHSFSKCCLLQLSLTSYGVGVTINIIALDR